jgi:hypothetical protein
MGTVVGPGPWQSSIAGMMSHTYLGVFALLEIP